MRRTISAVCEKRGQKRTLCTYRSRKGWKLLWHEAMTSPRITVKLATVGFLFLSTSATARSTIHVSRPFMGKLWHEVPVASRCTPCYYPDDANYRLGSVHTCLYVRGRETGEWNLFRFWVDSVQPAGVFLVTKIGLSRIISNSCFQV